MDEPRHPGEAVRRSGRKPLVLAAVVALALGALAFAGCSDGDGGGNGDATETEPAATSDGGDELSGSIEGDGSSTVFPIAEAVAEEFLKLHPDVRVTTGVSGTGGGFEKFCAGETDFSNGSRAIEQDEIDTCTAAGIEFVEFEVASDGLAVVTNPANDFVDCLTVGELNAIWGPDSTVSNWSAVRAGFPDKGLALYGPGTDSGTFDYFTDVINGEEGASRADYTASEDDNVLVQGVAGDEGGLGYFGLAYAVENSDSLKLLGVDGGAGCVVPSATTVNDGTYTPLSRPLYVYIRTDALERAEMKEFIRFWLTEGPALAEEVGYVRSADAVYQEGLAKIP